MRLFLLLALLSGLAVTGCAEPVLQPDSAAAFVPDPTQPQRIYLWDEGNMPAETDGSSRPYIETFPARTADVKGAVLVCPGGAFQFLSEEEGRPVARELAERGYAAFVVYYRVSPYSMDESTLDLARAVRFVRKDAELYGFSEDRIAAVGFSAGGILIGNEALFFDSDVTGATAVSSRERTGRAVDPDYVPDSLDEVSADLNAAGMCYSFYGILSHASTDVQSFINGDIPPTFFCYGSEEVFRREVERCISAVRSAGVQCESLILPGYHHGFGPRGGWIDSFCQFLDSHM